MVEEYEEDMIKVFGKADSEDTESQICGDIAGKLFRKWNLSKPTLSETESYINGT